MMIKILLLCAIFPFIRALINVNNNNVSSNDDPPALLGPDRFCFFAYSTRAKPFYMQKQFQNAVRIGVARLPYHRLDFNYYDEAVGGSPPTIVPDCGYEVWGAFYTIPVQDLNYVLSKGGLVANKKVYRFMQKIIETYVDGNIINLKCNAFQQIEEPEKIIYGLPLPQNRRPAQQTIDRMVDAFEDAGLPKKYIQEVSQIPTRDRNILETNLVPTSQQNPAVIVAPDSLVVAPESTGVAHDPKTSNP